MCLHNFSGAFFFKFFYLISQQFLSKNFFFSLICNPLLVMCIWYKCSILLMIFIFWSIHGYYIRKEKNLCFSGVCQPNQKLFIDYLPVWGNSNLIFSQCPWCISSYGCWLLWALCLGGLPLEEFCVTFYMWYKGIQKPHLSTEKLMVTLMNLTLWDFIPPNNTPRYPHETPGPFGILKGPKWMPLAKGCPKTKFWGAIWCTAGKAIAC